MPLTGRSRTAPYRMSPPRRTAHPRQQHCGRPGRSYPAQGTRRSSPDRLLTACGLCRPLPRGRQHVGPPWKPWSGFARPSTGCIAISSVRPKSLVMPFIASSCGLIDRPSTPASGRASTCTGKSITPLRQLMRSWPCRSCCTAIDKIGSHGHIRIAAIFPSSRNRRTR